MGSVASPPLYTRDFRRSLTLRSRYVQEDFQEGSGYVTTVFVTDSATGTETERSFGEEIRDPVWLPDGDAFAWIGAEDPNKPRAAVPGDDNPACSIVIAPLHAPATRHRFPPCARQDYITAIAPSTRNIWTVATYQHPGLRRMFLWNLADANAAPVGTPEEEVERASWSPDGRHLLYNTASREKPGDEPRTLRLMDVVTGRSEVVRDAGVSGRFTWKPDGTSFATAIETEQALELREVMTSTLNVHIVTSFPRHSSLDSIEFPDPEMWRSGTGAWSPDGQHLLAAVVRRNQGSGSPRFALSTKSTLFAVRITDGKQTPLTGGQGTTWFTRTPGTGR